QARQYRLVTVHRLAGSQIDQSGAVGVYAPDVMFLVTLLVAQENDLLAVDGVACPDGALRAQGDSLRRICGLGNFTDVDLGQAVPKRAKDYPFAIGRPIGNQAR